MTDNAKKVIEQYGGPDVLATFSDSQRAFEKGEYDAALSSAQQAFAAKPGNEEYQQHLAAILKAQQGAKAEADKTPDSRNDDRPTTMQDLVDDAWKKPPKKGETNG